MATSAVDGGGGISLPCFSLTHLPCPATPMMPAVSSTGSERGLDAKGQFAAPRELQHFGPGARMLAIGLSSRKNLCVNPSVVSAENRDSVDAGCRKLTVSWVRAIAVENPNIPTCS